MEQLRCRPVALPDIAVDEQLTDEELIARHQAARDGSPARASADELFEELFRRHGRRVARWCLRFTRDRNDTADLVQEVFLKAFRNLSSFRGEARFTTWIYVIARHHCLSRRSGLAHAVLVEEDRAARIPDPAAGRNVVEALERAEEHRLLQRSLEELLNRTESQVMKLHYCHEVPLARIGRRLGLTNPSGAKAYVVSARRKLEAALAPARSSRQGGHKRRSA